MSFTWIFLLFSASLRRDLRAINVIMTGLFLWPLVRSRLLNLYLRRVARRAVIASVLTLLASFVNILILTFLHGRELGWLCLTSCGSDVSKRGLRVTPKLMVEQVVANAGVLFWVTSGSSLRPQYSVAREGLQAPLCVHCNGYNLSPQGGQITTKDMRRIVDRTSVSLTKSPTDMPHGVQDAVAHNESTATIVKASSPPTKLYPDSSSEVGKCYNEDSEEAEDSKHPYSTTSKELSRSVACQDA